MSLEKLTQETNRIHNQQTKMWQEKLATAKADLDRMGKEIEKQRKELDKHRWIPVSERLPESCKSYPVSKDVLIVMANEVCLGYYQENHRQWVIYGSYQKPQEYLKAITHWKPIILPEQTLKGEI